MSRHSCVFLLICCLLSPGHALNEKTIMLMRPKYVPANFKAMLTAASYVAELAMPTRKRKGLFDGMGNIFDVRTPSSTCASECISDSPLPQVPDEVMFYAQAATLPGVHLVGEVGFNAGHSAIAFLYWGNDTQLVSFDVGQLRYSAQSLEFLQRIYPGRVERVTGYSQKTVSHFASTDTRKFDLFAIDGDHGGDAPYQDMVNGRRASRRGAYVLIDDWTPAAPAVMAAWSRAKEEGWVREVLCVDNMVVVAGARKAYCLGQYI